MFCSIIALILVANSMVYSRDLGLEDWVPLDT